VILDDGSSDGTGDLVQSIVDGDPRVTILDGAPLPAGWLGKPYACHQLARAAADAENLVFVDADVVLEPHAVAAAVTLLREADVDLVCPYPKILADGAQRLVQPLLQWSWLTFLPLRAMERSRQPALSALGGQFFAVRTSSYVRAGGHEGVRDRILEDIELGRAVKRSGGRIALADGSPIATCRMYDSWGGLVEGYSKSMWASYGSPAGAAAVIGLLLVLYVLPPVTVLFGQWIGLAGYGLGVLGRIVSARATGGRWWPDAFAHPVSVVLFGWLVARSYAKRRSTRWKGRPTWPA
jgi:hypothetical protein